MRSPIVISSLGFPDFDNHLTPGDSLLARDKLQGLHVPIAIVCQDACVHQPIDTRFAAQVKHIRSITSPAIRSVINNAYANFPKPGNIVLLRQKACKLAKALRDLGSLSPVFPAIDVDKLSPRRELQSKIVHTLQDAR